MPDASKKVYEVVLKYKLNTFKNFLYFDLTSAVAKEKELYQELNNIPAHERRYYGLQIYERKDGSEKSNAISISDEQLKKLGLL